VCDVFTACLRTPTIKKNRTVHDFCT
jgi:hypothetical protein